MFCDSKYLMNELSDGIIKSMNGAGNPEHFSLYLDRYIKYSTTRKSKRDVCKQNHVKIVDSFCASRVNIKPETDGGTENFLIIAFNLWTF